MTWLLGSTSAQSKTPGVIVELAAGGQQLRFGERLAGLDGCDIMIDQSLPCVFASQRKDVAGEDLGTFVDVVDDVDVVRVVL